MWYTTKDGGLVNLDKYESIYCTEKSRTQNGQRFLIRAFAPGQTLDNTAPVRCTLTAFATFEEAKREMAEIANALDAIRKHRVLDVQSFTDEDDI